MNRRHFAQTLAGVSTGLLAGCSTCPFHSPAGYIDCHAHLWPAFGEYPFREGIQAGHLKPESFTADQLIAEGQRFGFDRFVLIQHNPYHGYDYSYLRKVARERPGVFAVVGSLDAADPQLEEKLKTDADSDVTGYRIASKGKGEDWLSGPAMDRYWRLAAEYDQAICLLRNPNVSVRSVVDRCRKSPQTRVVIDHYGHIDYAEKADVELLWRLSDMENVYLKVSKYYGQGEKTPPYRDMLPFFHEVLAHFGSERLMWGSDSPYQLNGEHSYAAAYHVLAKYANLSTTQRADIFRNTARAVYFRGA